MAEELVMNVKSNIKSVTKETDELGQSIGKAGNEAKELGDGLDDAGKKGGRGIKKITVGFKGLMKAAGIIFLLQKAFEVFQETLGKNQKVVDFFSTSMNAISIAFNDLFKLIESNIAPITEYFKALFEDPQKSLKDFGDAIKKNIIERFESWLESIGFLASAVKKLFARDFTGAMDDVKNAGKEMVDVWTGVDDSFDKITETVKTATTAVIDYTKSTIDQAKAITETSKAAAKAGVEFAKLNAEFLRDAELQRQIRDDETQTFAKRIKANEDLNEILADQQKLQREQLDIQEKAAQQQYDINASDENWIILQEAKVAKLELEETITGQLSEQKTNQVALEKELLQAQNEVRAEGLSGMELELQELQDAYDLKIKMAEKAGMKTTAITKKFEAAKTKIVKDNENAKLAAISGFASSVNALAGEQKGIAVATALMNTYLGVTEVMKDPTIPSTTLKFLAAGTVLAGGLANVQNIMKQDVGGGGGGGGGGAAPQTPAPQMMSGAFEMTGVSEPEPLRAFVVTDEMTSSQNQLANIRRRATI